ncbi:MAG: hypothetical protein C7B46_00065 [Sulfobacillus benefaciens]|uniref:Lipoprotein n=1 Tax=Sulfobacillus benefaciens TaxID=453960 RepID=A0A2T2XLP3_9FIRM|nr:MAG: hypothetical protein C7B46_00065 [Sulfobacillus benefaciens]
MRHHVLIVAGVALGTLVLAGCGANGHLATPPPSQRHSPISQAIQVPNPSRRTTVHPFAGTAHLVRHLSMPLPAPYQTAHILYG